MSQNDRQELMKRRKNVLKGQASVPVGRGVIALINLPTENRREASSNSKAKGGWGTIGLHFEKEHNTL